MRFYATERLGPKQSLTPEGFLLCQDVPIARVGVQLYDPTELAELAKDLPPPGSDGVYQVWRKPEQVFHPDTIASYTGKPFTNDHPDEEVTPLNWKGLAVGSVFNIRRGEGADDDVLLADVLVTVQAVIDLITSKKKLEVSCGYDAEYVVNDDGTIEQTNIRGNHLALVDSGRCGSRCAIQDRNPIPQETPNMPTKPSRLQRFMDRIRLAVKDGDDDKLEKIMDEALAEGGDGDMPDGVHIHVHTGAGETGNGGEAVKPAATTTDEGEGGDAGLVSRLAALEAKHENIDKSLAEIIKRLDGKTTTDDDGEGEGDDPDATTTDDDEEVEGKALTGDSSALLGDFRKVTSGAEILAPGIRLPTFDRAAAPKKTYDAICALRRQAVDAAFATVDGKKLIDEVTGGKVSIAKLSCDSVRNIFNAAVALKRAQNNGNAGVGGGTRDAAVKDLRLPGGQVDLTAIYNTARGGR